MKLPGIVIQLFWFLSVCGTGSQLVAQSLRFYATPYHANEGDAVTFTYLSTSNTIPRTSIDTWSWDFDGDGVVDAEGIRPPDGSTPNLNAVWYATFDRARAVNGLYKVQPRLTVTTKDGQVFSETGGVTEDVAGLRTGNPAQDRDPYVEVTEFAAGNPDLKVTFGTSQRLATNNATVRFFSQIEFLKAGRINSVDWDFTGTAAFSPGQGVVFNVNSPTNTYQLAPGISQASFDVAMRVNYQTRLADSSYSSPKQLVRTLKDCVRIVEVLPEFALGRAYRRGFPEQYDWDDLVQTYTAPGLDGDDRVYFHQFELVLLKLQQDLRPEGTGLTDAERQQLAELVNELLQGQLLVGNQRLISALRIKYPRIVDPNGTAEDRLPTPPGVREETAAIDVAQLDFQAGLFHVFAMVQEFGLDILRSKAPEGAEPFPDFPRYLTFEDPSLGQKPIPIRNEWWQLTTTLNQLGLGGVEKAKKLFRLSNEDPTARVESIEECKKTGLQGYLGLAMLAAGQSTNDFALNEGNSLLAHVKNARDLFENINAGLNPLGNDGSFIPNESFAAIYQDAVEAVTDSKSAEVEARNEKREFDQRQATLRSELLSQRTSYITPLKLLTGIDPAEYNNLQTVQDQLDFRATVRNRVANILRDYPTTSAASAGEMGQQVLAVLDAAQNVQQRVNDLNNLFKRIDIRKWQNAQVNAVIERTSIQMVVIDFRLAMLDAAMGILGIHGFADSSAGDVAKLIVGAAKAAVLGAKSALQTLQTLTINDINLEAEIRGMLVDQSNLILSIERANNALDQARLALEDAEQRMDRLVEDLAHTRLTAENLYFTDPSFRIVVSRAQRRAEAELDFAVDRLYRLAKTLEYEWTEPFQNPLTTPALSLEPAALENPLFDKFTQLDSVFNIRSSDESKDYLDALKAWDSKLRRINLISVRGPNHAGPLTSEPISLREQIFNLKPGTNYNSAGSNTFSATVGDTIRQFRDKLQTLRVPNPQNPANDSLELKFATTIEDNRFFPATGTEWNMRIGTIRVDLVADNGFSGTQVAEVDLTQSGIVSLRRFFAEPPAADDLFKLTFNTGNRIDRSAFTIKIPSRINGATGGRPPTEFDAPGLAGRPVAATEWILRIDTSKPANRTLDFTKLKDIVIRFTYTYGNPPEFPGF